MQIRPAAVNAILEHAFQALPNECCGFLLGTLTAIDEVVRATNLTPRPHQYEADPRDHFAVIRRARREGRLVVGVYHSHPSAPAVPSASDLAHANYAEYLYLIVSLVEQPVGEEIRAYRLVDEQFEQVDLLVAEPSSRAHVAQANGGWG